GFGAETLRLKFVTDALYGDHLRGIGHPESPDRVEVVALRLRAQGVLDDTAAARDASDAELTLVHEPAYLELVKREIAGLCHPERRRTAPESNGEARYLSTGDV